jgi:hypothetical protein
VQLPEFYTIEGTGQLQLLTGHLRAKDEISQLALIDISALQLLVGSTTLFSTSHLAITIDGLEMDGSYLYGGSCQIWIYKSIYTKHSSQCYPGKGTEQSWTSLSKIITLQLNCIH